MMNISHINPNTTPIVADSRRSMMIGQLLLEMGKLTNDQLERILAMQQRANMNFGDAAKSLSFIDDSDIMHALSIQFEYSYLPAHEESFSRRLIAAYQPFSPQVEALRALRSQLVLRWFQQGAKMLAVISPNPGEGCSDLAANMAVVFSQLGERTLLIDANLRNPDQHNIFHLKQSRGLSDILIGRSDLSAINKLESLNSLSVLCAGTTPPNPQELLSRRSFSELLNRLREQYDVVIIDTPPAVVASDAQTVASACGGALLVSRIDQTRMADLTNVRDQLLVCDVQIVAAIANDL
jgi:chain length determinant protein tyrosine kinase EpsG